jgi:hypothetical protein
MGGTACATGMQGNDVYTYPPFSDMSFITATGQTVPMTDCCTTPTLPALGVVQQSVTLIGTGGA